MKRRFYIACCVLPVLLAFAACDDSTVASNQPTGKRADAGITQTGICAPRECPQPAAQGSIACCTPDAQCGTDPTGMGLGCLPNNPPEVVCKLADCPASPLGNACCTPLGQCGVDPFRNNIFCFPALPAVDAGPPPAPACELSKCEAADGGPKPCCQINGDCGIDVLGIGLCFPPPPPVCDPAKCPANDAGVQGCCALNNECGLDLLGIGLCFPPPPEATCDLSKCQGSGDVKACCLPNGKCGLDSLNIGICFPPPPPVPDAGPPVTPPPISTTPPDDPSITGECPSFIGVFGPQWGCCSPYGVCGTFLGDQCAVAIGTPIPTPGPIQPVDAGIAHRCTPPTPQIDAGP